MSKILLQLLSWRPGCSGAHHFQAFRFQNLHIREQNSWLPALACRHLHALQWLFINT